MIKRLIFILLFCLFLTSAFAATRTISDAGGNWNATTAWVEGAVPVAGDDVVATATSGNLAVNVATANLKSFDMTGYTGTLSGTSTITVLGATASTVVCKIAGTITWTGTLFLGPIASTTIIQLTTNGKLLTTLSIGGNSTANVTLMDNLSFNAIKTAVFSISSTLTIDMNGVTISGNSSINRLLIQSNSLGNYRTLTVNGGTFTNCDFRDISLDVSTDLSANSSGNCGGNTNITFTTAAAQDATIAGASKNWSDATIWTSRVPLPQDNVTMTGVSGTSTLTADMPRLGATIDTSGAAGTFTLALNSTANTIYGGLDLSGVDTLTINKAFNMECSANSTITPNSLSFAGSGAILFYARTGATISLGGTFTGSTGSAISLGGAGTFDANDQNISDYTFDYDTYNLVNLVMGNGTWTISRATTATVWDMDAATNVTAEGSTISITGQPAVGNTLTFDGQGKTYNHITIGATGAGNVTLSGSNAFNTFTINAPKTVKFTAGTTTNVSSFVATGTAVDPITITSATAATHTLSDSAGTNSVSYCTISYSVAQGGATWNANDGTNTDGGNNTGWNFAAVAAPRGQIIWIE